MSIFTIVGDKGGMGRSTLTVLLAEYLARRDYNVLCIGMDPQAVLARRFGFDMYGADVDLTNASGLFRSGVRPGDAAELIHPCRWDVERFPWAQRIHVIPDHEDLVNYDCPPVQGNPAARPGIALDGVSDAYDFTLVDTAPRIAGTLARSPWELADMLLGVSSARRDAIEGMLRLITRVEDYRLEMGKPDGWTVEGIVLNEYNPRSPVERNNLAGFELATVEDERPGLVWRDYTYPDGRTVPMSIPNVQFISEHADQALPMDALRNPRHRVRIDDPMNLIVNKVFEVASVSA